MKHQILNLGKQLKREEQRTINGGRKQCKPPGSPVCVEFGRQCAERECALRLQ
ncbi:hypothetical protein [Tenacibaculum litopenaei]|jgi:hypothetical protein|uniref:hypothetical protein n=1 Tax=Tenacibaculum litopenaei TaxID=396016 RepID=UPI0038B68434